MTLSRVAAGVLLAGTLVAGALAGCGGRAGPAAPTTTHRSMPQIAPEPDKRCRTTLQGTKAILTAEDGVALAAARYGAGTRGLVLVHQRDADLCGWARYVPDLVDAGLLVLAIDLRCNGYSDCPADDNGEDSGRDYAADVGAALAELHRQGATRVAVMGASLGAATAFVAAGRYPDQVDAVVGLSIFSTSASVSQSVVTSASDAAARVTAPTLICLSTEDSSSIQEGEADTLIAAGAARAKGDVVVRPGFTHGWDLLDDSAVKARVLAFLKVAYEGRS